MRTAIFSDGRHPRTPVLTKSTEDYASVAFAYLEKF